MHNGRLLARVLSDWSYLPWPPGNPPQDLAVALPTVASRSLRAVAALESLRSPTSITSRSR